LLGFACSTPSKKEAVQLERRLHEHLDSFTKMSYVSEKKRMKQRKQREKKSAKQQLIAVGSSKTSTIFLFVCFLRIWPQREVGRSGLVERLR
jgi:hypothetical protein